MRSCIPVASSMICTILSQISTNLACTKEIVRQWCVLGLRSRPNVPLPFISFKPAAWHRSSNCRVQQNFQGSRPYPRRNIFPHTCRDIWVRPDHISDVQHSFCAAVPSVIMPFMILDLLVKERQWPVLQDGCWVRVVHARNSPSSEITSRLPRAGRPSPSEQLCVRYMCRQGEGLLSLRTNNVLNGTPT